MQKVNSRVVTPQTRAPEPAPARAALGLLCPNTVCRSRKIRVTHTIPDEGRILRYRECLICGHTWKTFEN